MERMFKHKCSVRFDELEFLINVLRMVELESHGPPVEMAETLETVAEHTNNHPAQCTELVMHPVILRSVQN